MTIIFLFSKKLGTQKERKKMTDQTNRGYG